MKTIACTFAAVFAVLPAALFSASAHADGPFDVAPHESAGGPVPHIFTHRAMGTEFSFTIYPRPNDVGREDLTPIAEEAFTVIDILEQEVSSWIPSSNTSEINRDAFDRAVTMRPNVRRLLEFSRSVYHETDGAFDVTVGPLVEVWREALAEGGEPKPDIAAAAAAKVGMDKLTLDPNGPTARFAETGMRINFGGIAKGLALDKALEVLKRYGVTSALLSGGNSSLYAMGAPPGLPGWRIGIHDPYNLEDRLGWVDLRDESLSTSGCYPKSAETGEDRPCGIFDPRTGGAATGMLSVSVVAPAGMQTDALSTAFFVLGIEGIRRYCANHPDIRVIAAEPPADGAPKPVRIGRFD